MNTILMYTRNISNNSMIPDSFYVLHVEAYNEISATVVFR
jgi:hypothetical protein